jgi:hypothetical protein
MPDDAQSVSTGFRRVRLRPGLEALTPTPPPGQLWVEVGPRVRLLPADIFEPEGDLVS